MCSCFRSKLEIENAAEKSEAPPSSPLLSVCARLRDVVVRVVNASGHDIVVRVVHASGQIEMYEAAVPAPRLIRRNPGMCIATPDICRHPDEAVLSPNDVLLLGNKYFVVRRTTVEKLRWRHSRKVIGSVNAAVDESEESVSEY